jgi:hypothetical protein
MHILKLVSRIFRLLVAAFILGNLVYGFIESILGPKCVMLEGLELTSHKSTYACTGCAVKKHFSGPVLLAKDLKEF